MIKFNSVEIPQIEIEKHLKQELQLKQICSKILQQKIIAKTAASRNIAVAEQEIEAEANKIRCNLRLEKASDTLAWLKENLTEPEEWEMAIRNSLLRRKLAQHLFDDAIEPYFAQNRPKYDRFVLYQLVVPYQKLAQELFYQVEEEEISFYQAAHLYDIEPQRRNVCGYEGEVHRWNYTADIAAVIFKTPVVIGELIGPIRSPQGYHLFKIENYLPAQLTTEIKQEILNNLFEQWLASELNYLIHSEVPVEELN